MSISELNPDALLAALDRVVARKAQERQPAKGEQVISGAYGTADYATIAACYRRREKINIHGTLYRVTWLKVADGRFRAGVVACRST